MNSPYPLNSKDKKDLEVYLKQFCFKAIQAIVCSRHGCTLSSESSSNSPSWFNVTMSENSKVAEDCKEKVIMNNVFNGKTISLTIQLHTSENEILVLEIWTFLLDKKYEQVKVTFTVYNALCMLLRSVIAASRATPTYRLTRKQTNGGFFFISHEISHDNLPVELQLGDSVKCERIGVVGTPSGTLSVSVFYRTSLEIPSPVPSQPENKSIEADPTPSQQPDCLPFCPFADTTIPQLSDITSSNLIEDRETPFASLLESTFPFSYGISSSQVSQQSLESSCSPVVKNSVCQKPIAHSPAIPTAALSPSSGTQSPHSSPILSALSPRVNDMIHREDVMTSDSFVLIAPFASQSPEDAGSFFRDCSSVPKLKLFSESESQSSTVNPNDVEKDVRDMEEFLNEISFDDLSSG